MISLLLYFSPACDKVRTGKRLKGRDAEMSRREAADAREKATGMRQSTGAMIAKIAVGALFLISGVTTDWHSPEYSEPVGAMIFSLIIGLALIAWGLVPWLLAKKKLRDAAAKAEAQRQAEEYRRLNEPKLCPACGATTKGTRCEYCGTALK